MAKEVRQGAGLICAALVCALLFLVLDDQPAVIARALAVLLGIGGLALAAVGLFRTSSD
ncbi:DUF998 domain-containing protein [Nocardioides sp. SYSU D00065]|uniref:DUF998 domain-containing protein n=1 Tax=Nocardioides sp. SYSU D00065 TaxID=2817378 RepID=UPI001B338F94|nr:DUF998 domain-containing protein [Nocardioides sp. SYSU D00065]